MIQPLYTEEQRRELKQKQFLLYGGTFGKQNDKKIEISPAEIKQMEKDYRDMFIGFTSINWSKNTTVTLGMAWQKALEQMESFIATKTKISNHPVNAHLVKYHMLFKKRVSEHIMKCRGRESETTLPERLLKVFALDGTKMAQKGKNALNHFYKKYMPQQTIQKIPDIKKFEIAKQNIQQTMVMDFFARNRAA